MTIANGFASPIDAPRMLAAFLEQCDDAIVHTDLKGGIIGWGAGAARLCGYSADEMIGASLSILIPDERRNEFATMLDRLRAGVAVHRHETTWRGRDGHQVDVLLSVLPIRGETGEVASAMSIGRDISALRRAEAAQCASEARWRTMVDAAVDGMIVINAHGTIEEFNAAAERLFGYRADDVLGRSVNLLMPSPYRDEHDRYLADYVAGGPGRVIGIGREVLARRRTGEDFPARLSVGEMSVEGERRFIGIVHDLTERVAMEKRLREQAALAQLGEMAAVVAHEVRNALAAVQGAVRIMGARLPADHSNAAVVPQVLLRIDDLNAIVNDLLLFAHAPQPRMTQVDVGRLIAGIVDSAQTDPVLQRVRMEVAGALPSMPVDGALLRIALQNLFVNSAQAMQSAGTIRVVMESDATSCRIVVVDQGPGIPPDLRTRLFTPFFTTKTRGSGLGLVTAKRIIEAHAGTLRLECPDSGGTRAVVQLPLPSNG